MMQGRVIFFDNATSTGRISGADGHRYDFSQQDLKQPVRPAVGAEVDFEPRNGAARDIYVIGGAAAAHQGSYVGKVEPDLGLFGYGWRAVTAKYAAFSGRARRKEAWGFGVIYFLLLLIPSLLFIPAAATGSDEAMTLPLVILGVVFLALIVPSWAVNFRRLHDLGQPGWIIFVVTAISLIPYVGALIALIATVLLLVVEGQPHENKYGVPVKRA